MSFPNDIKLAMRDCILKVLWAKDDIVGFFKTNSCTASDVKALGEYRSKARYAIVDAMFERLEQKADEGLGPFRAMLQSLTTWSHFDPYYFDTIKKLALREIEWVILGILERGQHASQNL